MIIEYLTFFLGIIWSYFFIKAQSIFSKKTGILFKIFISKVSWITFIFACYFGFKNFSLKATIIGIAIGISLVHLGFYLLNNYLRKKFDENKLRQTKTILEYLLIFFIIYYIFF